MGIPIHAVDWIGVQVPTFVWSLERIDAMSPE